MNQLLRFLGLGGDDRETLPSIRAIADRLEQLPADEAQFVAAFALTLARVADADFEIDEDEIATIHRFVGQDASLSDEDAALVVSIVQAQSDAVAGSEGYLVTRELKRISNRAQRLHVLRCAFAVAAADGTISSDESQEIVKIGEELGFSRNEVSALRAEHRDQLSEVQALRRDG